MTDEKLAAAREVVTAVLRGERTPENDPALFEDDLLYFQVTFLSKDDPAWLEEALRDASYEATARFAVLGQSALPNAVRISILEEIAQAMPEDVRGETEAFLAFLRQKDRGK